MLDFAQSDSQGAHFRIINPLGLVGAPPWVSQAGYRPIESASGSIRATGLDLCRYGLNEESRITSVFQVTRVFAAANALGTSALGGWGTAEGPGSVLSVGLMLVRAA